MFNLKAFALASTLALGGIVGGMSPAEARPSDCWSNSGGNGTLRHFYCDVTRMEDRNGTWWNINHGDLQFRLYGDGTAQLWTHGRDTTGGNNWYTWHYDNQGDFRINGTGGYQFSFRK